MKVDLQRKLDRVVGTFLCRALSLFCSGGKDSVPEESPQRILVILLSEMGSLVLARPMFDRIRETYPECSCYALVFDQNREVLELLDIVPQEHIFTVRNSSLPAMLMDSMRFLSNARKRRIDTVIDCELFSRISSIYSFLSGARLRVGFHSHTQEGLYRGSFINGPVLYNPYHHISRQFITLVDAIGSRSVPTVKRKVTRDPITIPPLKVGKREVEEQFESFNRAFPQVRGAPLVLIYPGGGLLPIRAWPLEHFRRITEDLIKGGHTVGIIGMEEDKGLAAEIISPTGLERCIDLTGYTKTVRELMILFHFASLLITNDGGPGHFAAMTPVPVIILYGPETPTLYGSLSPRAYNFHVPLSCSPCLTAYNHRNSPCDGDNLCLKMISPDKVLSKAYEMLQGRKGIALPSVSND